jgi:glycerophosphoryl diester phosphodiesterase
VAVVATLLTSSLVTAGCSGGGGSDDDATPTTTVRPLEARPLVHAHRGASGYRPEETAAAYELAVEQGADSLEFDLVPTKEGRLVLRHEPEVNGTTDVSDHPALASLRTTKEVDGQSMSGWFVEDLTLAQVRTLRARERLPDVRQANMAFDGKEPLLTLDDVLDLRERLSKAAGREIAIVPEIKHSTYFHRLGLDPEAEFLRVLTTHGLNRPDAPVWLQSFELTNLTRLRELGYRGRTVFLAASRGAPFDLVSSGDDRDYADLLSADGLRSLAAAKVDAIGPDKSLVVPVDGDALGTPTGVVVRAHAAGLRVFVWTLRADNAFLPESLQTGGHPGDLGRADVEVAAFLRAGVDGLFCDQPDICVRARDGLSPSRSGAPTS